RIEHAQLLAARSFSLHRDVTKLLMCVGVFRIDRQPLEEHLDAIIELAAVSDALALLEELLRFGAVFFGDVFVALREISILIVCHANPVQKGTAKERLQPTTTLSAGMIKLPQTNLMPFC